MFPSRIEGPMNDPHTSGSMQGFYVFKGGGDRASYSQTCR